MTNQILPQQSLNNNKVLFVLIIVFTIVTVLTLIHLNYFSINYVPMCEDEFQIINQCKCIPTEMRENSTIFAKLWEKLT
jgi:hypothetical protein